MDEETHDAMCESIGRGHCPDCNYRGFVLGPRGGAAQNIECGNVECRHKFNVVIFGNTCVRAERIH